MAEVVNVEKREPNGKRPAKRLRAAGKIPANLYGHGEANLSLAIKAEDPDWRVASGRLWSEGMAASALRSD